MRPVKICPACATEYPLERSHCERDGVMLVALTTGGGGRPEELIGHIVDGRYLVEAIVGKGGMGTVYACRHVVVGKPLAMKVLRSGLEQTEGVLQRFIREAQTANSIKSRHIAEMTDFGQLPSGQLYVTMELLEGSDLGKALKQGLARDQLLHVFTQTAEALELTHRRGVVHRDLKPDNVFLVREGDDPLFVKLLDFGIAKAMNEGPSGLTETGMVLGTPYYMSPEQARGEDVDHRTDIYSLGVIMYRAFTGKLPFVADSAIGVLTRHLTEPPAAPSQIAGVDAPTEAVILRCMEKRRERRFQSMNELADALRALRAGVYTAPPTSVHMPAGPPSRSGPYAAAAVPSQSGPYAAGVPSQSGPYAAGPPSQGGPYAAASVPSQSGPYAAAGVPSQSGPYVAAAPPQSGTFAGPGVHPPASDVYTAPASAHAPTVQVQASAAASMGALASMGAPMVPEHTAEHGLAASTSMRIQAPPKRWPLVIGALGVLVAGGALALMVSSLLHGPAADGATSAQAGGGPTQVATAAPGPTAAAAPSDAPTASATASPSAGPTASAAPAVSSGAAAAGAAPAGGSRPGKPGSGKASPAGSSTTRRPPEIRSPFD
jgi:serine/threonine protein kinase